LLLTPAELRPAPASTCTIEQGSIINLAAHADKIIALLNCEALFGDARQNAVSQAKSDAERDAVAK